jgi:hypothetical protein
VLGSGRPPWILLLPCGHGLISASIVPYERYLRVN